MTLKVIGAGFGRTGTDSMRKALDILGLGPCHHMYEVNAHDEQKRLWRALVQGALPEWDQLFAGYRSCVDWPSAYYWKELAEFYPEAKVVLTWRAPEDWWQSFEKTIVQGIRMSNDPESLGLALVRDKVFGGRADDRAHAIGLYEENIRMVKASIAPERLLVHSLGDGWQPLCAFLGLPVPDQPYPSLNAAKDFQDANLKNTSR